VYTAKEESLQFFFYYNQINLINCVHTWHEEDEDQFCVDEEAVYVMRAAIDEKFSI